jgi:hypothetical protein
MQVNNSNTEINTTNKTKEKSISTNKITYAVEKEYKKDNHKNPADPTESLDTTSNDYFFIAGQTIYPYKK